MQRFSAFLIKMLLIYQICWQASGKYEQTADLTIDACEDFYEYACSNYTQQNTDPNYSEITQKLDYEMNKKLLSHFNSSVVEDEYNVLNQTFNDKMKIYLKSCNSETHRDLRKYFEKIKPSSNLNWPLLVHNETWLEPNKTFDFWSLLGQLQSFGLNNVIVHQQIIRKEDNSLIIWLAPALIDEGSALPKNIILQVLLNALGAENVELIIEQLNATEFSWREMMENYVDSNQVKNITIHDLAGLYPRLNLTIYLEELLDGELNNISHITLENPEYFEFLNQKLWSAKELEHLSNYLMMKFLFYLAVDSTAEFAPLECVKDLRNKFDLAVNFYYYHNFFKHEEKKYRKALSNMHTKINATMNKYFQENNLDLTVEQIIQLQNKLENIKINIGNLPKNFDNNTIQQFYQEIPNLDRRNYYKNHLLLLKHRFRKSLSFEKNQSHYIVSDNRMGAQSSPFYVAQQNMVVIPFGSFQLPLFHYTQNILEQLSHFGFVLAHELTHAFDTTGLNYDQQGFNLASPADIMDHANFTNSINCMQQQEPTEAIDERIADLFAVRVVYRAYLDYYNKGKKDLRKRFFLNLAQFFCGKNNLKFIDHDSDAMRLQLIVKNFREFSEVFGCPKRSPMHPKVKCRLY
ncbi:membrane metallo-endopeptidase-like 1 [Calliphora vicina]|uniref:membrane metallo-endopeptidase-like 1 n=1 Tax=Calliphora vicina TaxID=7373 RepID=UPI00325AB7D2